MSLATSELLRFNVSLALTTKGGESNCDANRTTQTNRSHDHCDFFIAVFIYKPSLMYLIS